MDEKTLDRLVESAKLTGRIDLLMELRNWLDEKVAAAEKENERHRSELK